MDVTFIDQKNIPPPPEKRDYKAIFSRMLTTGKGARVRTANAEEATQVQQHVHAAVRRYLPPGKRLRTRKKRKSVFLWFEDDNRIIAPAGGQ